MEETKTTRKPTRDYRALSESPWTFWDSIFTRRSCRKYQKGALAPEFPAELDELLLLAAKVRGAGPGSIIAVTEPEVGARLRHRLYKGLVNKINLWLARSPVNAFLVMAVPEDDVHGERPRQVPKAAMALEDCVLWLTERGLGTCWLGGVNAEEIKNELGLDPSLTVPIAISFGTPRDTGALSYDNILRNAQSKRRKPLPAIAYVETLEESYRPEDLDPGGFAASTEQGISGLLKMLREGRGKEDAPLELVVEACLEAARLAPSAGNSQGWHFVVVKDAGKLENLAGACHADATWRAAVVAAGRPKAYMSGVMDKPFWMIDVPIALSHMSLMAASMGCGARVFVEDIDEEAINNLVLAKDDVRTVGVLGIS